MLYTFIDWDRFTVQFRNDKKHGRGRIVSKDGIVFVGVWDNDMMKREGRYF